MGGGVAVDFALTYPELVRSLILAAPFVNGQSLPIKMLWKGFRNFYNVRSRGSRAAIEAFINDPYWSYVFPSAQNSEAREKVIQNVQNPDNFCRFPPRLAAVQTTKSMKRLNEIQAPTLIVTGDRDHAFNLKAADGIASKIFRARRVEIKDCGHLPFVEKPEEFNRLVFHFIWDN